jgi:hypothetical protein
LRPQTATLGCSCLLGRPMEFVEASKKKQNHDKYLCAQAFFHQTYVRFVVVFFPSPDLDTFCSA